MATVEVKTVKTRERRRALLWRRAGVVMAALLRRRSSFRARRPRRGRRCGPTATSTYERTAAYVRRFLDYADDQLADDQRRTVDIVEPSTGTTTSHVTSNVYAVATPTIMCGPSSPLFWEPARHGVFIQQMTSEWAVASIDPFGWLLMCSGAFFILSLVGICA